MGESERYLSVFLKEVVELFHQYAVVTLPEQVLSDLAALPEAEYIEPPETLFFCLQNGRSISCVN